MMTIACGKKESVKPVVVEPPVKPLDEIPKTADYHQEGDVEKLIYNGPGAVNIVMLGDGFIVEDLKKGGAFDTEAKKVVDYLFTVAPFKQYAKNFNVYMVYARSRERGAAATNTPISTASAYGSYFWPSIDRLLVAGNLTKVFDDASRAVPLFDAHLIVMIVNEGKYGGSGGSVAVVSTNAQSKYIMVHEIGHTFAGLGDEYIDLDIANNYPVEVVQSLPNVDTTANPKYVKWKSYLNRPAYRSYVNAFEGAYYRDKGFFRPEERSVMTYLNTASFNAPSREAIARRISGIIGIPFDEEAFIRSDASDIAPVTATSVTIPQPPRNDFINMRSRLLQLQQERKKFPQ